MITWGSLCNVRAATTSTRKGTTPNLHRDQNHYPNPRLSLIELNTKDYDPTFSESSTSSNEDQLL